MLWRIAGVTFELSSERPCLTQLIEIKDILLCNCFDQSLEFQERVLDTLNELDVLNNGQILKASVEFNSVDVTKYNNDNDKVNKNENDNDNMMVDNNNKINGNHK